MSSDLLFIIIISVIVVNQLFDFLLDYLNNNHITSEIPKELADVYNKEEYSKQQAYKKETASFSFWSTLASFITILLFLFLDGFAFVDDYIRAYIGNEILVSLVFLGTIMLFSSIISLPFSIYGTFVIEEKYGFNKTTAKTFWFDLIKGAVLSAIIGGLILYVIILLYQIFGEQFWILAWLIITAFSVFMNMFYSNLIVPLFNKQKPLEAGSLRDLIENFSKKSGFKLNQIFVIDGSKRSSKANAYFSGLGPKKRIVLYDTLLNDLEEKEILAVLAHEIGHYKHKHSLKGIISSIVQTGMVLFLFSLLISNPLLNQALGSEHQSFHFGLIVFGFIFSPFSVVIGIFMSFFSRKHEYQADAFTKQFGLHNDLISGLKQLSRNNLSNLTPHPLYVFIHYSHPTVLQRIRKLNE